MAIKVGSTNELPADDIVHTEDLTLEEEQAADAMMDTMALTTDIMSEGM